VEERALLPEAWRDASTFSDWNIRLTPKRATALLKALEATIDEVDREDDDGNDFVVQLVAFPRPGTVPVEGSP
jgi:hypothetical protein